MINCKPVLGVQAVRFLSNSTLAAMTTRRGCVFDWCAQVISFNYFCKEEILTVNYIHLIYQEQYNLHCLDMLKSTTHLQVSEHYFWHNLHFLKSKKKKRERGQRSTWQNKYPLNNSFNFEDIDRLIFEDFCIKKNKSSEAEWDITLYFILRSLLFLFLFLQS